MYKRQRSNTSLVLGLDFIIKTTFARVSRSFMDPHINWTRPNRGLVQAQPTKAVFAANKPFFPSKKISVLTEFSVGKNLSDLKK